MIQTFRNTSFKINVYGTVEHPYFKASEVAKVLGYKNTNKAIINHVDNDDKITYNKLNCLAYQKVSPLLKVQPHTIFINESGLYSLILSSKLPKAKEFKHWITNEVLPSIRKTGQYINKDVRPKIYFNCQTESDIQKAIVNYLRNKYPKLYFTANLGELQDTEQKRITSYQMGYTKGSPDLFIFHRNRKFEGLAIEFKSPQGGQLSDAQNKILKALADQKWDVLVSNDLFEIVEHICKHLNIHQLPPKKVKKAKMIPSTTSILEYFDDENEDELEEMNMEGLINYYEEEGEMEIAECLAQELYK